MFEICSEFVMTSMRGAIERAHWMRLSNGQSCLSIAPPIEIIIANFTEDFKHWAYFYKVYYVFSKPGFYNYLL